MNLDGNPARHKGCVVFLLAVLLSLCGGMPPAQAQDRIVRVGVYENAPKIFTDDSGKPAGIFIDIIEHIAKAEGWELQYVAGTWEEGLDRLANGEIDLMPDVAFTAEREKLYLFHKVPVLSSWSQVYARKNSGIRSIMDLNEKRIAVLQGSVQQEAFTRLSDGFGLKVLLLPVPDYKRAFAMVAHGEADGAISNNFFGMMHTKEYGLEDTAVVFSPAKLLFAAPKNASRSFLAALDRRLTEMKEDPGSAYYQAMKRWSAEDVAFKWPLWLKIAGFGVTGVLILSLAVSAVLKQQVRARTRELQRENAERKMAQQRFMDIIDFLPDATFVIDKEKRVLAWNRACEAMTGVRKEQMVGRGDYVYAEPFFGERRPVLIDLLDHPAQDIEATYAVVQRKENKVFAESFVPRLRDGRGVYLWGVASPLFDQDGRRCGAIESIRDITEQKLMEEALRKSEREYRELVMLANSIILRWSPEGKITFLNEFGQRFFGYSAAEILGRLLVGTLVPENENEGRDLRQLIDAIAVDPAKFERNINQNIRRNGERVWVDWTNKVVLDEGGKIKEILSIGSDITERRIAEEEIRRLHDDLQRHAAMLEQRVAERTAELAGMNDEQRTIFESAGTGIVLLRERIIVRCNRKLEEIFGYAPDELVGQSTRVWYPDEETFIRVGNEAYAQIATGETYRREYQVSRKDGTLFWARLSIRAIDPSLPVKGTVGIIEDITEEREAAENLRQAMAAAQEADRIKSAFLATMSHELRTPLNSIIGFTGIMLQGLTGPLNPEQQKQMTMVQKSSRHLLSLINDVLDISKIEAGQLELSNSSFDMRDSIEKMTKLVEPLAEKKKIELHIRLPDTPMTLVTDQRRLEQVILNLLNNAVKFTEEGGVGITCRAENGAVLFSVSDTGIGIREEDVPGLFQPFHQIDTGLSRKHEGTGLGLSICQKILEIMGGTIAVKSTWGHGSTFSVRIPRQQVNYE